MLSAEFEPVVLVTGRLPSSVVAQPASLYAWDWGAQELPGNATVCLSVCLFVSVCLSVCLSAEIVLIPFRTCLVTEIRASITASESPLFTC
jgi:hypothetical protein